MEILDLSPQLNAERDKLTFLRNAAKNAGLPALRTCFSKTCCLFVAQSSEIIDNRGNYNFSIGK